MDIGTMFEWVARVFGIAFVLFMLLVLFIPSWHEPRRQRQTPTPRLEHGNRHDGAHNDAA